MKNNSEFFRIFAVKATIFQILASVIVLINPFSAIIAGFIMDAVGRLNLLRLSAIPTIIGWILIATSVDVPMLIIGRLFVGFGASKY